MTLGAGLKGKDFVIAGANPQPVYYTAAADARFAQLKRTQSDKYEEQK